MPSADPQSDVGSSQHADESASNGNGRISRTNKKSESPEKVEPAEPTVKRRPAAARRRSEAPAETKTDKKGRQVAPVPIDDSQVTLGQLSYDPIKADRSVRPKELVKDKRFWQVARTLTAFVAGTISEKYGKDTAMTGSEKRRRRARRIREALVELGPTFIKLGQFLSVRRDILSDEIADELAYLQDKVPPFDIEVVRKIIELDLGDVPEKIFARFEEVPIASASIGQVHRAWLQDGTPVVAKVQRPNLAHRFYQDLGYMRLSTRLGAAVKPSGAWDDWLKLSDEFGRTLFQEINYIQEGKNADRVRQILKGHSEIRVPRVFWKHTGKRVLTLEYIPGIKISDVKALQDSGMDLVAIGNRLVTCYLDQVLLHGFFHADPHAGNIAIDDWGNVVLYDFGMIGEITDVQRDAITGCIAAVIKRDSEELVKHLKVLGIVKENARVETIKRAIEPFIDYYAGKGIRELDFSHLESDIDEVVDDRAISMPPTLAYLLRTGTSLEGVARTLHPNFSFVEAAKPSLKRWILSKPDQAAQVLKLMGSEYSVTIKAALMRLVNSKTLDNSLAFLQDKMQNKNLPSAQTKNIASTQSKTTAQESEDIKNDVVIEKDNRDYVALQSELEKVKTRVNVLENEIEEANKNRVNLVVQSLWLLSFSVLFLGFSLISDLKPYANLFLIGFGVMVAKIIGHLVRSSKLRNRSGTTDLSRRQRR